MLAKRHDLAKPLLQSAIRDTAVAKNHIWSKAQWALGRMEAFLENYAAAAAAYQAVALAPSVPQKFRLQARILWAQALAKVGNLDGIDELTSTIPQMLDGIADYDLLLNFARQLQKLGGNLQPIARQVFEKGEAVANHTFESTSHPTIAIDALFKLTRRQLYDFSGYKTVIARWESLPPQKLTWMWTNNRQYWMYFALVAEAYMRDKNPHGAAVVVGKVLNEDDAQPAEVPCPGQHQSSSITVLNVGAVDDHAQDQPQPLPSSIVPTLQAGSPSIFADPSIPGFSSTPFRSLQDRPAPPAHTFLPSLLLSLSL